MLNVRAARKTYTPIPITDFGAGLLTRDGPQKVPLGAARRSLNCDYFGRNINNRRGFAAVLENGPGAVKIADFEAGEGWVNGAADAVNFVTVEAAANGARGRSRSQAGAGTAGVSLAIAASNLGTDLNDVIHLWVACTTLDATVTGYKIRLRFTTSGGNYYEATVAAGTDTANLLEAGRSRYYRTRRQAFTATGTPDWTSITAIDIFLDQLGGAGTVAVTYDNLHRTPGVMQALFQFKRESGAYKGATDEYAIAGGVLYRNGGQRWTSVFSGFDASAPVYHKTAQDRVILSDGVTTPRVLMADGTTVYRLGILPPARTITATQIGGGHLSDGDYFVMVAFYSSKTGTFSGPDLAVPTAATISIGGGGGTAGIRFANIPVSADPQVDWVVIGVRPANSEKVLFLRITDGAFGDVANGTTTFDFVGAVSELLARSDHPVDPDNSYPTVIDATTGNPVEAHPLYLEELGGYIVTVMAEQPTVLRFSRFRQPGSWSEDDEVPIGENDSQPVTGLAQLGSSVLVGKRDAVYWARPVGGDVKVSVEGPVSERGPVEHRGIVKVADSLWYRSQEGLICIAFDQVPRIVSDGNQDTWESAWSVGGFGQGCAVRVRGREQILHFGRSFGSPLNDLAWCTHHRSYKSLVRTKQPELATSLWNMSADVAAEMQTTTGYQPWIGANGQVFRANFGSRDDGRTYQAVHRTPLISKDPQSLWAWREVEIESKVSGTYPLTVQPFIGATVIEEGQSTYTLEGDGDPLGSFVLGTDRLGSGLYTHKKLPLPRVLGRYLALEFRFQGDAEFTIYRIAPWCQRIGTEGDTR